MKIVNFIFDYLENTINLLLEMLRMAINTALFNPYGRAIVITFICIWVTVVIIHNRHDIKEYISIYLTDVRIYKTELKHYDDITFKLFGRNEDGYTLKDFLPVTKERIEHFKAVKEWEQINVD